MSDNVKVSFYIPRELEQEIGRMVERGLFTTKTDVYQEALRRLLIDYQRFELEQESVERVASADD